MYLILPHPSSSLYSSFIWKGHLIRMIWRCSSHSMMHQLGTYISWILNDDANGSRQTPYVPCPLCLDGPWWTWYSHDQIFKWIIYVVFCLQLSNDIGDNFRCSGKWNLNHHHWYRRIFWPKVDPFPKKYHFRPLSETLKIDKILHPRILSKFIHKFLLKSGLFLVHRLKIYQPDGLCCFIAFIL